MSWFLTVINLTPEGKRWNPDEPFPENGLLPLGSRAEIHALIAKLFPYADFFDPLWISEHKWGMEFVLDHDEPVKWFSLRHGSEEAARIIHEYSGWDVFDPESRLMDFDKPA
jgi:hypothetical protein